MVKNDPNKDRKQQKRKRKLESKAKSKAFKQARMMKVGAHEPNYPVGDDLD